ncbi:MAG TPA: hypothetical protein IAB46_13845 [Candidatus Scybalocola faecigallinarum]|uniref:Glycine zipper domain-containing protein n=1 Tax=Candidatus Scybalocola faecigallinarum TaxID=2840941 RepID=A0A9D1F7G6_9FIRM|nr:hypothetical protein [Candidatus Scybalocola faecigallinarum]
MTSKENEEILAIDEELVAHISIEEAQELKLIQKNFIESYLKYRNSMEVDEWLRMVMEENLPDCGAEKIAQISDEIIMTLKVQEEKKVSLEKAISDGRSKESWFASEAKKATSYMSVQEASKYLQRLDSALKTANESLYSTIHTQADVISQNPHLDGFIAEQYHAQTFNLNAEITGSPYRAKVLEPSGKGYTKNSVDIVIIDESGHVVKRYQCKYCKDAEATAKAFEHGDYRGQQKLVPEGQEQDIAKKVTTVIEAPDGTTSNPLSKERAKELQNEAQSGKWNDLNWNEYKAKDLAIGIGKQAEQSALMGAAIGVGFDIAHKVWNDEEIKGEELIETAIVSGADFGVKAAAAGALKAGVEKGVIKVIPKGTPAGTIANIVHIGIENVKIVGKMATGELTAKEGFEKMEQTTVATVAGIATSTKGSLIGATIGTAFGPIGTLVGGFVGGTVGYMAGSKVGETIVKCAQKVRETAKEVVKSVGRTVVDGIKSIGNGISNFVGGLIGVFGW